MNRSQRHLNSVELQCIINNEAVEGLDQLERHLEHCTHCQQQLERLVADQSDWDKTRKHLSDSGAIHPVDWMLNQQTVAIQLDQNPAQLENEEAFLVGSNAATELGPPSHPEMLGSIDDFEVEKEIGRGGCGVVYKAFDRELNRPVAIKVLAPQLASSGIARQRFAREARAAAAVVHPNVVPIHGVNSKPPRPYIVMSLVNGRSLDAHVRDKGALETKDVVRIAHQIASGLAAAHRQGLIHRDIKPANILLEQDVSRVMITDFGLARASDEVAITKTGWLAGTPHYMSPEQARGDEIDQRSDLFSLGSLIYFIATGSEPFRAEKPFAVIQKIISDQPASPRQINSDIPKTLERIIERLLGKKAEHRFRSAAECSEVLEAYLAHLNNPTSSPKPRVRSVGRKPFRAARVDFRLGFRLAFRLALAAMVVGACSYFAYVASQSPRQDAPDARANFATTSSALNSTSRPQSSGSELEQFPSTTTVAPAVGLTGRGLADQELDRELSILERQVTELETVFGIRTDTKSEKSTHSTNEAFDE